MSLNLTAPGLQCQNDTTKPEIEGPLILADTNYLNVISGLPMSFHRRDLPWGSWSKGARTNFF